MPQSCGVAQPGLCTFTGSGLVRWTGAVAGWSEYRSYAHYDPASGSVLAEIWERFVTARVGGCGLGSFLTHGSAVVEPRDQDPMKGGIRFHATWSFVDGTGTGELAHVTSGRFSTDGAFELATFANHGTIKGYLTCAR